MNEKIKKQIMALIQGVQAGDQQATQAMQQIMTKAKQGDQKAIALAKAIQTVMKEMQQGSAQNPVATQNPIAARFGAKLNYIRTLKGNAPEGMVVEYYKEGGQVKKKFVKPAGGAKEKDGKKVISDFKKKACGGTKMKFEDGGKPKKPKKPIIQPNDTVHIQNPATKKMEVRDLTNDHRHKQYKRLTAAEYQRQSNSKKNDIDLKGYCKGGKAKKHQQGGSLNGIPFTVTPSNTLPGVTIVGRYPTLKHTTRNVGGNTEHTLTWPNGKQIRRSFNPAGSPTKGWISGSKGFNPQSDFMGIWNRMVTGNPRIQTNNRSALRQSTGY